MDRYDVAVLGGGASGMMAALVAAQQGKKVLLIEKNKRLGEKLDITGGGRCNILNAESDVRRLLSHYGDVGEALYSPFSQFGVSETTNFFKKLGIEITIEKNKRAFPKSQKATDVTAALVKALRENGVTVKNSEAVLEMKPTRNKITQVKTDKGEYTAHSIIVSTGGYSHPETGSTGDGFKWLAGLGIDVQGATPNIVPIKTKDVWVHDLAGVSVEEMKITFFVNEEKRLTKKGRLLFTHFGLSGPLILNSAKEIKDLLEEGEVTATIDLFPKHDIDAFEKLLIKAIDENKNKDLKNVLKDIAPAGTVNALIPLLKLKDESVKAHSFTKEERKRIVKILKALPVSIVGLMGFDRAVVSDGGVPLTEIDTRTMRTKKFENLYLIGDVLHIPRPSGGYSLQLCWTTGYIAGINA
jgi:predicted Rossmann fold flavoprotein